MNATAHIAYAFLKGEKLTIKTAFERFGISNLPRECGRSIERKFHVRLDRVHKVGKTRNGIPCSWVEYRLLDTKDNRHGRLLMKGYVMKELGEIKTGTELKISKTLTLL